jgi:SARP family transcriptional regulator, regulator of embCAB operon
MVAESLQEVTPAVDPGALNLFVCGRLAVVSGSVMLPESGFPGQQGRRAWAALALARRGPISRDDLSWAVWGDAPPDAADATLNAIVSRLRRATAVVAARHPRFALVGEPGRYYLALPEDAFIDWVRARDAIHAADRLAFRGEWPAALAEARVAMEIAARGFLPGHDGPWAEGRRSELVEIGLRAADRTIEGELARGRPDLALIEARLLIAIDPLRESGWRGAMRAVAASGNPALAGRLFTECREVLDREAGMGPAPETVAVWTQATSRRPR